jgi:hypothetical protein
VFATGDALAVEAAVICFKKYLAVACPGLQCIAYGVRVSGLPRFASVEVSMHVLNPAALDPAQELEGVRLYQACASCESCLIVAFIRDGERAVSDLTEALTLMGDAADDCDVACTAWTAGALQQQLAAALDDDEGRNWSVLPAHGLYCGDFVDALGNCAAVLSVARHRVQP